VRSSIFPINASAANPLLRLPLAPTTWPDERKYTRHRSGASDLFLSRLSLSFYSTLTDVEIANPWAIRAAIAAHLEFLIG